MSEKFNAEISINRISYGFKRNIIIQGLFVADQTGDTLLYLGSLEANLKKLSFTKKIIYLDHIILNGLTTRVKQVSDSIYNYDFLIGKSDTSPSKPFDWDIRLDMFHLENNSFSYETHGDKYQLSDFKAHFENVLIDSSHQSFNLIKLSFGFNDEINIQSISFNFKKESKNVAVEELSILTDDSYIGIDGFWIETKDSVSKPIFHFNNVSAKLYLHNLGLFFPEFKTNNQFFSISGNLSGNMDFIRGKKIKLKFGEESILESNFMIENLTNPSQLNYSFDVDNFRSSIDDIEYTLREYLNKNELVLPEALESLGNLTYKGRLEGTTSGIINQGVIYSDIGEVFSDLKINFDTIHKKTFIDGNLKATPIYLQKLVPGTPLNEVTFNINTKGFYSASKGINLDIRGMFQQIAFNKQTIDSIGIVGSLTNDVFEGRISSFDPKLRFDFEGIINLDTLPSYDFKMNLYSAQLYPLGIIKSDTTANMSMNLYASFKGNRFENTSGNIVITDLYYFKDTSYFATDSITISMIPAKKGNKLTFNSEYVTAYLEGYFNSLTLAKGIESIIYHYIPSFGIPSATKDEQNNFSFSIIADYPHPITEMFLPDYRISPGTTVTGNFNEANGTLSVSCFSQSFRMQNREMTDLNVKLYTRNDNMFVNLNSKEFRYAEKSSLKNFLTSIKMHNDSININFNWNNWQQDNYSGNVNSLLTLQKIDKAHKPKIKLDIFPSNIIVLDSIWYIGKGYVEKDSSSYVFSNLKIDNRSSSLSIDGKLSANPEDSIVFNFQNMNLVHLNTLIKDDALVFNGNLTGNTTIKDITQEVQINSDFTIDRLSLNHELIGDTKVSSKWNKAEKQLEIQLNSLIANVTRVYIYGNISPLKKQMDFEVLLNQQSLKILEPFLQPTFVNFEGEASGLVRVYGELDNPKWNGKLFAQNAGLTVSSTMVHYKFSDSIALNNYNIVFDNIILNDIDNNQATITGNISHERFSEFTSNLRINSNKILGINTKFTDNPLFYGKLYAAGYVKIYGPSSDTKIDIVATTKENSQFFIPLEGKGDIGENGFIEFVDPFEDKKKDKKDSKYFKEKAEESLISMIIDLTVTPEAVVQILFDPKIGDALKATGFARLNMEYVNDIFTMFGDYKINKGEFALTLQNVINKKFEILQGSSLSWSGDPIDANIKMDAIYRIKKASVYDLTMDDADKEKKVEVEMHLKMEDKLMNPTISFAVSTPANTNLAAIDQINTLPEEELNKQVLSLLLLNKFMPLYQGAYGTSTSSNFGATTVSELLSNQLSDWMSEINDDIDLGFVYRPGTETTQQEYEVALSTKLWNDRISLNGNVGYTVQGNTATADNSKSPYTTDFQIEYKVNEKGNIRLRAFQKINNDIEYTTAPYTQGIGIFYTEDFDHFNELMKKIFKNEYATKPEDIEIRRESSDSLP